MLRELHVILYCSYVEGKLGLKSPMTGNEAGTLSTVQLFEDIYMPYKAI